MDEARRFLRYVTPGFVFATESALLLWLVLPDVLLRGLRAIDDPGALIATAVGAVIASGGLGFIFSVVHHSWHWLRDKADIDYRPCVAMLEASQVISITTVGGQRTRPLSRGEAWLLVSILWEERRATSKVIETANQDFRELNDLFHSLGAARIASLMSPALVALYALEHGQSSAAPLDWIRGIAAGVIALTWFAVLWTSMRRVGEFTQTTLTQTLAAELIQCKKQTGAAFELPLTFPQTARPWCMFGS
jgi:hypothetical protein